ncbi:MAG: HAD family hydrolase [Salibacteraceae bacterium]
MNHLQKNLRFLKTQNLSWFEGMDDDPSISDLEKLCNQAEIKLENLLLFNLHATTLPWHELRFVFLDVDGVMTEGGMFYTEDGDEFKRFDTKDGMAIKEAMKIGIEFGIISSGVNKSIIQHRADMFGIRHVYVGAEPKLTIAKRWLDKLDLEWKQCGYVGDDINDLQMFDEVGINACPADAVDRIKGKADFVLQSKGGHGCIREFMSYVPALKPTL